MTVSERIARLRLQQAANYASLPKVEQIFVQSVSFTRVDLVAIDRVGKFWDASVSPNWTPKP